MRLVRKLSPFLLILLLCGTLVAQASSTAADTALQSGQIAQLQQQIADAKSSADNAWMLVSSALVLLMTGPGLALFYGGLVRKKNVLATMMQSFAMMALVTVLWAIVGYSLCFGSGNNFIGGLEHAFLHGVGAAPDADYAATIPQQTFMIYQLMFAIITPALICGAFAERMKFSAMLLFMTLWSLMVYAPMAHMVWGKGGLLNASLGGRFPTLDFAGGTVVHITSGVSALICALFLGRRVGFPKEPMPPHSVVLSFIGACLLWVGWFGFNAGSALSSGSLATSAFVATHFAAAAAAIGWAGAEWIRNGKPSVLGAISGSVAGLVAITPAAGFVAPMPASADRINCWGGCYIMVATVKARLGYDDSLDAFGVHGAGGTIGALLDRRLRHQSHQPNIQRCPGTPAAAGHGRRQLSAGWKSVRRRFDRGRAGRGGHIHHLADRQFCGRPTCFDRGRSAGPRPHPARRGRLLLGSVDAIEAHQ